MPDPIIDPNQLSTFAKDIMKNIRVAFSAQQMMAQRKGPKNAMQQFVDKQAAAKQAGKISRELSNYFRSETFTKKRLPIEEQAEEAGKMKLDPMPKLDVQLPPPPVSGGESSAPPDPRRRNKKPGKPDAKLVPSRFKEDKSRASKTDIGSSKEAPQPGGPKDRGATSWGHSR